MGTKKKKKAGINRNDKQSLGDKNVGDLPLLVIKMNYKAIITLKHGILQEWRLPRQNIGRDSSMCKNLL